VHWSHRYIGALTLATAWQWAGCGTVAWAIVDFSPEGRGLTPPQDETLQQAWKAHGQWKGATGVAIAPDWFITVAHLGSSLSGYFDLNGKSYRAKEVVEVPKSDLLLYRVEGLFSHWVELWDETHGSELGRNAILMGRGAARGELVQKSQGGAHGWLWGASDGQLSWGTNQVLERFDAGPNLGDILVWTWDQEIGGTEGTLSAGDSGGGLFLLDAIGQWRMAGIHFDVDPGVDGVDTQYSFTNDEDKLFWASIYDARGLWRGVFGETLRQINDAAEKPVPMYAGSTRLAPHVGFIRQVIQPGSKFGEQYRPRFRWTKRKIWFAIGLTVALSSLWFVGRWKWMQRRSRD
jgi:hypothetical protein